MPESNVITKESIRHMDAAPVAGFSIKSNESDDSGGISTGIGSSSVEPSSTKTEPDVTPGDTEDQ